MYICRLFQYDCTSRWPNKLVLVALLSILVSLRCVLAVAYPEGVRGVQTNPLLSLSYFIFMGNFRKNKTNCTIWNPLSLFEPPMQNCWIRPWFVTMERFWLHSGLSRRAVIWWRMKQCKKCKSSQIFYFKLLKFAMWGSCPELYIVTYHIFSRNLD